ncbi:TPA: autotransporter outer membrane beta-barrel domain-containing protein [Citrobacter amalonaticus]|nr:autotransporter outer membrane beta-barrel domain-containing protein [Citrobacter amalonaticus]
MLSFYYHWEFKPRKIALIMSAILASGSACAADDLLYITPASPEQKVTINNDSVWSRISVYSPNADVIVNGKTTVNGQAGISPDVAISQNAGKLDLGDGSVVNFTSDQIHAIGNEDVIDLNGDGQFTAKNLTVNSTGAAFDGIGAHGSNHLVLKGTTNINLNTTKENMLFPMARAEGIYLQGHASMDAENINVTYRSNGPDTIGINEASGLWLWNNEASVNITGTTNVDLETLTQGALYGVNLADTNDANGARKHVFMNEVNIKMQSNIAYNPAVHNAVSGFFTIYANAETEVNKLNINASSNNNLYGLHFGTNTSDDKSITTIHEANIYLKGGEKSRISGVSNSANNSIIGKLTVDTEGGENVYLLDRVSKKTHFLGDVTLGSQKAYNTTTGTLYSIYNSATIDGVKLVAWGKISADPYSVIDIATTDNSYLYGDSEIWRTVSYSNIGVINMTLNGGNTRWDMTGNSKVTNLTLKDATLNFLHEDGAASRSTRATPAFKTLTLNGDYHGENGHIVMNTALGDDASETDHLTINGNTSGSTTVQVKNAGGNGALTTNGIELISVAGASDGVFKQSGRIVAGAYDYNLLRGNGQNANNWYLTSALSPEPVDPVDPTPAPASPEAPATKPEALVRPEAGLYGANLYAANTMFNHRLQDRLGETHYTDAITGEESVTSLWLRNSGGHTRAHDNSGQLGIQSNRYVMQLGSDIAQWSTDNQDRYHVGVMAGYANQKSRSNSNKTGYRADSSIDGYSVGMYGTWLQNNETQEGAYVDTWALYNWFDNTVSGEDVAAEKYKSKGFTGSVEAGYTWKLSDLSERSAVYIQPKAQATWMGVKADSHKETNGTRVEGKGDGNLQTRLGIRLFGKGHHSLDDNTGRNFQPFVEVNWIRNSKDFGATLNGESVDYAGTKNIGEVKAGVEGQLNKNVTLWGNVAQQVGDKGYSDTSAMLGVKVAF